MGNLEGFSGGEDTGSENTIDSGDMIADNNDTNGLRDFLNAVHNAEHEEMEEKNGESGIKVEEDIVNQIAQLDDTVH